MGDVREIGGGKNNGATREISCVNCAFAVTHQMLDGKGQPVIGQHSLECRFSPPQIVLALAQTPQGTVPIFPPGVTFPPVTPAIWCHQFLAGTPQADEGEPELYTETI